MILFNKNSAFSLLEMCIALAISVIIITMGYLGVMTLLCSHEATTTINNLQQAIYTAKSTAMYSGKSTKLCASNNYRECTNNFTNGFIVQNNHNKVVAKYPGSDYGNIFLYSFGNEKIKIIKFNQNGMTYNNGHFSYVSNNGSLTKSIYFNKSGKITKK